MITLEDLITVCYIDDRLDRNIERYINEFCVNLNKYAEGIIDEFTYYDLEEKNLEVINFIENKDIFSKYSFKFTSYNFNSEDSYKTLLDNELVKNANIIIIDSWLFENENSTLSKFTGEQFRIILRQILPFIKTIVISQNGGKKDSSTVEKWKGSGDAKAHYHEKLLPLLTKYIFGTIEEQNILNQLSKDEEVDGFLVDTIKNTAAGLIDTALFEKKDLDELIRLFNEVKHHHDK